MDSGVLGSVFLDSRYRSAECLVQIFCFVVSRVVQSGVHEEMKGGIVVLRVWIVSCGLKI